MAQTFDMGTAGAFEQARQPDIGGHRHGCAESIAVEVGTLHELLAQATKGQRRHG